MSPIQALHDMEINGGLAWPENGRILVYLGCPLDEARMRERGEALVDSFGAAEAWLKARAADYGETVEPRTGMGKPVVQRLFAAGVRGSVYWMYDGGFGMTLPDNQGGASSWREAEAWMEAHG